jgi:hypothetical protein
MNCDTYPFNFFVTTLVTVLTILSFRMSNMEDSDSSDSSNDVMSVICKLVGAAAMLGELHAAMYKSGSGGQSSSTNTKAHWAIMASKSIGESKEMLCHLAYVSYHIHSSTSNLS